MAEIIQRDGTWTFDGDTLRLTPGRDKNVSLLRSTLGELAVPLGALAGISFEQGKKAGRLRLRLRDGADPLLQATGGRLTEPHDPYQLSVDVRPLRRRRVLRGRGPQRAAAGPGAGRRRWTPICSPGPPSRSPSPPGTARRASTASTYAWSGTGRRRTPRPPPGRGRCRCGHSGRRVAPRGRPGERLPPLHRAARADEGPAQVRPQRRGAVGLQEGPADGPGRGGRAGPAARTRRPRAQAAGPRRRPDRPPPAEDDHDALLRRLRELGDLHRSGVLTDEEFTMAKQAVLKRM